ncbi:MAG: PhoH family protein [Gammaproteobacteria bacterium]|nr:PhoH family protein [Gammaproteobacteria bacterium]
MKPSNKKLFVLDTNVLMHDPTAIFRFDEHDIYIPIVVLEELDKHKRGLSEVSRNVRQVSRYLDDLVVKTKGNVAEGIELPTLSDRHEPGHLYFYMEAVRSPLPNGLQTNLPDNALLGITHDLDKHHPDNEVTLVSKDINLRIKAHAIGLNAEDYTNDKVLDDANLLYGGMAKLPDNFWETYEKDMESWKEEQGKMFYKLKGTNKESWFPNQFVYTESESPFEAIVRHKDINTTTLEVVHDYRHEKNNVWGITARNREQNFALNLLMDPEIDFVTLLGHAGTGKTLLTLAAALTQTLEEKRYTEIIMTRMTVPVGEDIGFLPGTEQEKMEPWMGALEDNLDVLHNTDKNGHGTWGRAATQDLLRSRIQIKSLNFMRGRTFLRKFIIIDEAQNLSPHQMKTLVTRAGPGTKVACLGNIAQIDTPYLTETSSGLTYVVDRFKDWEHSGQVTLQRGERSRLADHANEIL